MICVWRVSTTHSQSFCLSVVVVSDADDERSSSEAEERELAVERSDKSSSSEANELAVEHSDKSSSSEAEELAVERSDRSSSSEAEELAVDLKPDDEVSAISKDDESIELSDEESSSSDRLIQQPLAASKTPPLYFPSSPTPHEAMFDDVFNMEGDDQQYGTPEEEVRSFLFYVYS